MLHEIILALHGYVSSILNKNSQAVEMVKVLHPSEKALLKRILQIGETYAKIQVFIDKYICPQIEFDVIEGGGNDENGQICGMYLQAFCDGVQKVLQPYRNDVVALEKMAMQDPYLSLACINSSVGGYSTLLCMLYSMIGDITEENIHGCKILQYVSRHLCTGVETMRDALLKIVGCCHVVLVNQLTNWLLYGRTMDQYGEFFIREKISSVPVANVREIDDDQVGAPSSSFDKITTNTGDFVLEYDYLPPYISYSMGNKILYIGRTVVLFKTGITGKSEFGSKNDVFLQEEIELVQSIRNCSFQDTQQLENVVINLEESVTKRLWVMAMEKADLMGQLTAMKDFYLLSRGELFVDFLNKIGGFLNKQISSTVARDLNLALVTSARNVQYYDDLTLEKFQFKLPSKDSISVEAKVKSVLRLEYSPTSPLHLFFSPVVIDNYNVLFRFFLKVKQAQLNLHTIWMKDVKNKKQLLTDRSWQLRNDLMLLVENMQCYLQWDVVESEHTAFLFELKRSQDFEKIRHLHHRFLFNILSQAFLIPNDAKYDENTGLLLVQPTTGTSTAVRNVKPHTANVFLCHILDLSEAFCQLVTKSEPADIHDELETMSEKLSHCVKVLLRLITNLRNQVSGVHLSKLLLRLDYNHFFSQNRAANVHSKT